jgi:hypothetical protein
MILGACKNLGVTPDYVLHSMTYENMIMYGFATPTYDLDDKDDWDESLDANNPDNFKGLAEGDVTNPFKGLK